MMNDETTQNSLRGRQWCLPLERLRPDGRHVRRWEQRVCLRVTRVWTV